MVRGTRTIARGIQDFEFIKDLREGVLEWDGSWDTNHDEGFMSWELRILNL